MRRTDIDDQRKQVEQWLIEGKLRSEIAQLLGCRYNLLYGRLKAWELDHYTNRGRKGRQRPGERVPLDKILRLNGKPIGSHDLKKRLWIEGLKPQHCEICGWCEISPDGRLPLHLDHINGNCYDNRLENLRVLCPNHHALQPTSGGKHRHTSTRGGMADTLV